jgi:hypothetical protein
VDFISAIDGGMANKTFGRSRTTRRHEQTTRDEEQKQDRRSRSTKCCRH